MSKSEKLIVYSVSLVIAALNILIVLLSGAHPDVVASLILLQSALHSVHIVGGGAEDGK